MLQRGSLPSEIALQGRSLESKMVYRGVGAECGLRKTEKIFSANNEQGTIKRGEKWFPEKLVKKIDHENFRSESFSIRTSEGRAPASELVLQRGSLPSEEYRGVSADFEKPKEYFRLIMNSVPEYSHLVFIIPVYLRTITLSKSLVLASCSWTNKKKSIYSWTNQKVQLQL